MFSRLGRWCHDHRWIVIGIWVAALFVGNGILAGAGGAQTNADFSLPNVESKEGTDILEDAFGGQGSGFGGTVVFYAEQGVDDPGWAGDGTVAEVHRAATPIVDPALVWAPQG